MLAAIVNVEDIEFEAVTKGMHVLSEHMDIWQKLKDGIIVYEKNNYCILDILEGLKNNDRIISDISVICKNSSAPFFIIPLTKKEVEVIF